MPYAAGRIGSAGMFLRTDGVDPVSRARVLSQDRRPVSLLTPAALR